MTVRVRLVRPPEGPAQPGAQTRAVLSGLAAEEREALCVALAGRDRLFQRPGGRLDVIASFEVLAESISGLPEGGEALWRAVRGCLERPADSPPSAGGLPFSRRACVMGILNVTPDSFSDGGRYWGLESAVEHGLEMVEQGADVLDVGGESTRPGAEEIEEEEEARRVIPVIEALRARTGVPISVDTTKAEVARRALAAGACIVNDVSAGRLEPSILEVAADAGAGLMLMHVLGQPRTMQEAPHYDYLLGEIYDFLAERAEAAVSVGVASEAILVDPGIGFGKTREHNLELLRELAQFRSLGYGVAVGTSRKSFIGLTLDLPVEDRVEGTAATVGWAVAHGACLVRVHDVRQMARVVRMTEAIVSKGR